MSTCGQVLLLVTKENRTKLVGYLRILSSFALLRFNTYKTKMNLAHIYLIIIDCFEGCRDPILSCIGAVDQVIDN